jgi:endo-1,4-beta-xylanase
MKHTLTITIALIMLSACAPVSTNTTAAPSAIPSATIEPTKLSTPTLISTLEPSKISTTTLIVTATPRPELSWTRAFTMLATLINERTILDKDRLVTSDLKLDTDRLVINNLKQNDANGVDGKPVLLDAPFGIALKFSYQGANYGAVNLSGVRSPTPWWKGLIRLWVRIDKNQVLNIDIHDGTSDKVVTTFPLRTITPNSVVYIIFSDPQGMKFSLFNEKGETIQEIDVTKLGQGALTNGLFPERNLYPGFTIGPDSQMIVSEFSFLASPDSRLMKFNRAVELPKPSLSDLAKKMGITFGTEVNPWAPDFNYDARYNQVLAQEFASFDPEYYGFDWAQYLQRSSGDYQWGRADEIVSYAKSKGLYFLEKLIETTDHPEANSFETPAWIRESNLSRDQLFSALENHIRKVVGRYKGTVTIWKVVNEADFSNQDPRTAKYFTPGNITGFASGKFWNTHLDPETYIEKAFQWARESDPNAVLIYNNAFNETLGPKSDFEYNFLARMKQKGVPIDGIGMEMNLDAANLMTDGDIQSWKNSVIQNMRRFGNVGIATYITELNVNLGNVEGKSKEDKLALQAKIYKAAVEACIQSETCKGVQLGGFTDAVSWVFTNSYSIWYGKGEAPNILDEDYKPKPAYYAVRDALMGK